MRFVSREYHFVILCRYGADMEADTSPDPNANADTDADTSDYVCWNIRTVRGYGSWYECEHGCEYERRYAYGCGLCLVVIIMLYRADMNADMK
jgi:hypothetical protein